MIDDIDIDALLQEYGPEGAVAEYARLNGIPIERAQFVFAVAAGTVTGDILQRSVTQELVPFVPEEAS